jgi:hypothetical protein
MKLTKKGQMGILSPINPNSPLNPVNQSPHYDSQSRKKMRIRKQDKVVYEMPFKFLAKAIQRAFKRRR